MLKQAGAMGDQTEINEAPSRTAGRSVQDHAVPGRGATPAGKPRAPRVQPSRGGRRLIVPGGLMLAVIFGVVGLLIISRRAADLTESRQTITNLAQVLAEQTARTLQPVDLTLREIAGRLTAGEAARTAANVTGWGSRPIHELLVDRLNGLPQVDVLMVVGADGHMLNYSRAFPAAALDVSDRDYFQYFRGRDDHAVFVSSPVKAYLSGKWIVILSRRVNDSSGGFAGVVNAAVTLSYFEDFYRAVTAEHGAVTVLRRDGVILVHYPHAEQRIGARPTATALWKTAVEEGGGFYRSPADMDGVPRLVAVHPLREFPLVIDTSTSEAAALSAWHRQALWLLTGAMGAAAGVIFLLRLFSVQYGRLASQNAQLESSRMLFDAVLENMSQGLILFDGNQNLLVCNRRFAEMYRLSASQIRPGTSLSDLIGHRRANGTFLALPPAQYATRGARFVHAKESFELTDVLADGRTVFLHSQPVGGSGGWVSTHEDITDRCRAEAALVFMARHDALTELPNRLLFQERLAEAIVMARGGTHCALLCLDLDRFKTINDTLGHPVGDALLRAVAGRLGAVVRDVDTVARLGGDEFAIIQSGITSSEEAERLAARVIATLCQPFDIDGHKVVGGTSIGISVAPRDGTSSDALLKSADIALYLAKTEGRGTWRFFEPEMDARVRERREVELDLRDALPAEAFDLYYQPMLDIQFGKVTGFEALIRWNHPIRGLISPADFIPIAEEFGLIVPIGEWVLKQACTHAAAWPRDIDIAINLSPVQFKGGHLLDGVRNALAASGLNPRRLVLEITESVLLQNSDDTLSQLHQLRALGIRVALDDFGTGYSSLGYLRSFPFDKIKIDRTFIRDIDTNNDSAVIVGAIVGIAQGLGMTTVAEGVETASQLARVRDLGCVAVQGYLFSPPRPVEEVLALIRTLGVPDQSRCEAETMRSALHHAPGFPGTMAKWNAHYDTDAFIMLPP